MSVSVYMVFLPKTYTPCSYAGCFPRAANMKTVNAKGIPITCLQPVSAAFHYTPDQAKSPATRLDNKGWCTNDPLHSGLVSTSVP